jgi:hypothetical protein
MGPVPCRPYSRQGDVNSGQFGGLSILLGNGDGTFQPAVVLSTDSFPTGLSVGDFNDDARPDLAVSGYASALNSLSVVGVFIGMGDGTFQPRTDYSISYCPDGGCLADDANSIVTGDFNRDSKQDLAVTTTVFRCDQTFPEVLCGNTDVLLGSGDGTFQPVAVTTVLGGAESSGATADFDGDKGPDLVITFRPDVMAPAQVATILGNGDGTFQPPRTLSIASFATTGDLDEDGKAYLLTLSTFWPQPVCSDMVGKRRRHLPDRKAVPDE